MRDVPVIAFKPDINYLFFPFSSADVNECERSPCRNGGICTDLVANYSCECPGEYMGRNCQYSKYMFLFLWMLPSLSHFFSLSPSSGLCIKLILWQFRASVSPGPWRSMQKQLRTDSKTHTQNTLCQWERRREQWVWHLASERNVFQIKYKLLKIENKMFFGNTVT